MQRQTRQRWIGLIADRKARITIAYFEPPFAATTAKGDTGDGLSQYDLADCL